jgi:hypothetical protein
MYPIIQLFIVSLQKQRLIVDNFFLALYKKFNKMGMNGKDLDSMLNSLPWKLIETRADGTEVYECEVKNE